MKTSPPAVTIGVMTHNYGHYIAEAIESVLAQTRTDWELIVSDDASADDTAAVVAPYLRDPRIRYVRHADNLGQARHWAFLLAQGTAPVVCVLHADDAWLPEALATVLPEFAAPQVDLVFGNWRRRTEGGETEVRLNKTETLTGHALYRRQVKMFTCLASGAFLTRRVAQGAGLPDPSLRMVVDYEYFLRVAAHARQVRSLDQPLVIYRVHSQSTTHHSTRSGVFNEEMERLPALCAAQIAGVDPLKPALTDLRKHLARSIFSEGQSQAAQGNLTEGRRIMRRGLRLYSWLLLQPKVLVLYFLCFLTGNLHRFFRTASVGGGQ